MTQLPSDEMAIIAGFRTMTDAEKTVDDLKQVGILDYRIDRVSMFNTEEFEKELHNPITGKFPGLANATFDVEMDRDSSVLASANPSASGMSDGNDENVGMDVVLTVVVNKEKFDQAEKVVRENGGSF